MTHNINTVNSNDNALDQCAEHLGMEEAIDMFDYALPLIVKRKQELCSYLQTQDWEAAKQCAHQTISSVRLYGSQHLETQLQHIRLLDTTDNHTDPIQLEKTLAQAFDQTIQEVTIWLDKHKDH